jgi:hypothetical protein
VTKIAIETPRSSLQICAAPLLTLVANPQKLLTIKPLIFISIAVNCTGADALLI